MAPIACRLLVALLILFVACARAPVVIRPVVDIPPYPTLPVCVEAHVVGSTSGTEVRFSLESLEAYREAIAEERACLVEREALVEAWGKKLLNRLKAVTGP